jgi:hypothetical protein
LQADLAAVAGVGYSAAGGCDGRLVSSANRRTVESVTRQLQFDAAIKIPGFI